MPAPSRFDRLGALGLVLLLFRPAMARGEEPRWLIRIDTSDQRTLAGLSERGGTPVRIAPGYTLCLAGAGEKGLRPYEEFHPLRLARWNPALEFYLVYPGRTFLSSGSDWEVLYRDERSAVVRVSPQNASRLAGAYPIARIFDRPLRCGEALARGRAERARRTPLAHDAGIQGLVDRVSLDSLEARVDRLVGFRTRRSDSPEALRAQDELVEQFTRMGYDSVVTFDYNGWSDDVLAIKRGLLTPERIYIIGGHYDSISRGGDAPGADDNASGTVGVCEAARVLADQEFESTLIFAAWSGEEQGLYGSEAWSAWAASVGLDIRGYLNLDMEGYLAGPRDLDVISNPASSTLRDLVFAVVPQYVPDLPVVDGYLTLGSSDHASFWENGYPALFFFEDSDSPSPYIHSPDDVVGLSLNSFPFMKQNVQAAVATLASLAAPIRIRLAHAPLADQSSPDSLQPVVVDVESVYPLTADSPRLRWRCEGGPLLDWPLVASPAPHQYVARLPAQTGGVTLGYYLEARDEAGHVVTDPPGAPDSLHTFLVGYRPVFEDDCEEDRGWTVGDAGDAALTGIWVRADPEATQFQPGEDHTSEPGRLCFVTGNGEPGGADGDQDVDGGRTSLLSPILDLDGAVMAKLSYFRWYAGETRLDDQFRVFISNDGGAGWSVLEETSRSERSWIRISFPHLEQTLPLTSRVRFKFVAEDIGNPSLVEAALDDIAVSAYYPDSARRAAASAPARPFDRWLASSPNPSRQGSRLLFELHTAQSAEVGIFDPTGRALRRLRLGILGAGPHSIWWDGRDEKGRALPSGLYYVRLRTAQGESTGRLSVLR